MSEQVGGHGGYMLRWTSPIDGAIKINGYIYQTDTPDRLTNWTLLRNDVVMTTGFTKNDGSRPMNNYENRVSFEEGSNRVPGTYTAVAVGDEIDLITPGTQGWGCCGAGVNVLYQIEEVDPSEIPAPEIWSARAGFVEGLDQSIDFNDPWSYRAGESNGTVDYGDLLTWNPDGQWNSPPAYTACLACEERPVLTGTASFVSNPTAEDPVNEQVGGHGSYMLRWQSPFDGWIQIEGYIYQTPTPDRLTTWQILKNNRLVNMGTTGLASDGVTPLNGFKNRVGFERGRGGLRGTFIEVSIDDEIDLITPGTPGFGDAIPAGVNTKYVISRVNVNDVPTDRDSWDATIDFVGGLDQAAAPNDPWSYRNGNDGELLAWNPAGLSGSDPAYTDESAEEVIIAGAAQFGGFDPLREQMGGRNLRLRWTSPVTGTVAIEGYVYQTDTPDRRTHWQILKGGNMVTEGFTPLNGFDNRVSFADGSGGLAATFVDVSVGDTIELITPGTDGFDNATSANVNASFHLTQVPGGTTLRSGARDNAVVVFWDAVPDGATFTIDGYDIIRTSPLPGGKVNDAPITGTLHTIVGLASGVEYCHVLQPVASNGRSGPQSNEVCNVPTQDDRTVWDARVDWVDELNQTQSPNLPWSYRSGEPDVNYGELLIWNPDGQFGSSPAYTLCLDCTLRPVFAGTVQFGGFDELEEQVGGHGSYMLRWTSPISGVVQVEGYVYQTETPDRLTNWKILKNDAVFTEGFTAFDEFGPLNGYDNRVFFDSGSGGLRRTFISVGPGDTIDLITPGTPGRGCCPAAVSTLYRIRIADPSEVPAVDYWDARQDFLGGFDQTVDTNDPWTYRSAEPNAYGDLLVWNPAGQWGSSAAYTACLDNCGVRPILAGSAQFGGQDAQNEQIGGHGAFMVRWTSPIDGEVNINGYVYQTATPDRLTHWQFLKNDAVFWQGFTAFDEFGPLNDFENRVFFEDGGPPAGGGGAAGLAGLTVEVSVGDNIDLITPADLMFGSDIPAGLNLSLRYTPDGTEMGTPFRRGDHDGSGIVDITDPLNLLGFLFLGTTSPICADASDGDNSGALDISDALNLLGFLFLGSFPLNETLPGPTNCGPDPTVIVDPDGPGGFPEQPVATLGCDTYPSATGTACP
jgi:hypothetical protein